MIDSALSIALLAVAIWAARVIVPRALRLHDGLAIASAALTLAIAVLAWLLLGIRMR